MMKDHNSYRILIIEDNPGDFTIVEDFLVEQILSPDIIQAVSFKIAAAILLENKNPFDIILLDVSLPDKTGKQLITEILQLSGATPVIILTGYTDIEFSIQSVSLGVLDYLLKDELNPIALYKSILHAIERKKIIVSLEESEKRYSDLFHFSPQPMLVVENETSAILDINQAAIDHYGYSKKEFLLMTIKDIQIDQEMPLADKEVNRPIFFAESYHPGCQDRQRKKNGDIIEVEIRTNRIQFNGKPANLMLMNDITEKAKYISAIEDQNKQLREIAWIQSHVVRAPLARMMGIINVVNQTELTPAEQKILLESFVASGNELDIIIRDITLKTSCIGTQNT